MDGNELSELELAYSCARWAQPSRNADQVLEDFSRAQRECHEANLTVYPHELGVAYAPDRYCDLWAASEALLETGQHGANDTVSTLLVYFHGGYWQMGDRTQGATLIPTLLSDTKRPLVFAAIGYDYATSGGRTVTQLVTEYAIKAVEYLSQRFPKAELLLCGHSAGAHLATKAAELIGSGGSAGGSGEEQRSLVARVKKLLCLAGVYDLNELVNTYIGRDIGLTRADAASASLDYASFARHLHHCSVLLLLAEWDAPKIGEQNGRLFGEIKCKLHAAEMKTVAGVDHFSSVTQIQNSHSEQSHAILEFIHSR